MDGIVLDAQTMRIPIDVAPHLSERYDRFMVAIASEHSGDICDEAKSFLECIFRTIIINRNGFVDEGPSGHATFIQLFDQAWGTLLSAADRDEFYPIIRSSVKSIGEIRNNYGGVSHGQDGYDVRSLGLQEAMYTARQALSVATYLYSHHLTTGQDCRNSRISYGDNPNFNEYLDSGGDLIVAGVPMLPSEILFNNDLTAYKEQLIEYSEIVKEDDQNDRR